MSKVATILAISGAQQSAIASRFAAAGWTIRGTSRTTAGTAHGPKVVANLETGEGLEDALAGADVVVLTLPQDHRAGAMPRIAETVARAAAKASVGRLIFNAAGAIAETDPAPLFADTRAARDAVRSGGAPFVLLQPTVFMDNLLAPWSLPDIAAHGVIAYPAPERARISWISHRTLADAVYAAATHPDATGLDLRIGGPEALTAADLCALLGARLGRNIRYQRIPLDGFAAGLDQALGAPAGQRIAAHYARLDTDPDALAVDESAASFLAIAPESFSAFAARHAWQVETVDPTAQP